MARQKYLCHYSALRAKSLTLVLLGMSKKGSSNLRDQKSLIRLIFELLKKTSNCGVRKQKIWKCQTGTLAMSGECNVCFET